MGYRVLLAGIALCSMISTPAFATQGADYRTRYRLSSAQQKLVDNQGDGFNLLYGTRNFRSVLNGVYYRGGANNYYHKTDKRDNMNPLPNDGLQNLCEEGFSTALYLYTNNYSTAPHVVHCKMNDGSTNTLEYLQLSILSASREQIKSVLSTFLAHVRDPNLGPIYAHCWNGWHASGLTATYALRQFCGLSASEGVNYWNLNTDGNNGSSYEGVRDKIRAFLPFADLNLSAKEKADLCPDAQTLKF